MNTDFEDALRQHLQYDPKSGELWWIKAPRRNVKMDIPAGGKNNDGYRTICLQRHYLLAHRVAFFLAEGRWPNGEIDHINGDRSDNRRENLREASRDLNGENIRRPMAHNSSGLLGVTFNRRARRWQAQIKIMRKTRYLGLYDTKELAHAAYLKAKRANHRGCTI